MTANRPRNFTEREIKKTRAAGITAANEKLARNLPEGWRIVRNDGQVDINGELHTWHHGTKKGEMELIPTNLHKASQRNHGRGEGPHIGLLMWWNYL